MYPNAPVKNHVKLIRNSGLQFFCVHGSCNFWYHIEFNCCLDILFLCIVETLYDICLLKTEVYLSGVDMCSLCTAFIANIGEHLIWMCWHVKVWSSHCRWCIHGCPEEERDASRKRQRFLLPKTFHTCPRFYMHVILEVK